MKTETAAEGIGPQETSQEQESLNNTTEDQPDVSKNAPVQKKRKRCWTCNAKLELAQRELGNCRCSKYCYYLARQSWGKSERSDWFFLGLYFAIWTISMEMVISCVFFILKAGKFKTSIAQVPYNKLLTNLACSSRTGEYWPSVVFVRNSLRSVRTGKTSGPGQYSPLSYGFVL